MEVDGISNEDIESRLKSLENQLNQVRRKTNRTDTDQDQANEAGTAPAQPIGDHSARTSGSYLRSRYDNEESPEESFDFVRDMEERGRQSQEEVKASGHVPFLISEEITEIKPQEDTNFTPTKIIKMSQPATPDSDPEESGDEGLPEDNQFQDIGDERQQLSDHDQDPAPPSDEPDAFQIYEQEDPPSRKEEPVEQPKHLMASRGRYDTTEPEEKTVRTPTKSQPQERYAQPPEEYQETVPKQTTNRYHSDASASEHDSDPPPYQRQTSDPSPQRYDRSVTPESVTSSQSIGPPPPAVNPEQRAMLDNIIAQQKRMIIEFYQGKIMESQVENETRRQKDFQLQQLRGQLSQRQAENTRLQQDLEIVEASKHSTTGHSSQQALELVDKLTSEIAHRQNNITILGESIRGARQKQQHLEYQISQYHETALGEKSKMQHDILSLKKQVEQATHTEQQLSAEIGRLKEENVTLTEQLDEDYICPSDTLKQSYERELTILRLKLQESEQHLSAFVTESDHMETQHAHAPLPQPHSETSTPALSTYTSPTKNPIKAAANVSSNVSNALRWDEN